MSSSLHPKRWPLRTRLIVEQVVLIAIVCAGIGIVSVFALRDFQINQLDQRLREASGRVERGGPLMPGMIPPNPLDRPGFPPGTLVVFIRTSGVDGTRIQPGKDRPDDLPAGELRALASVPADATARTVQLGAELGEHRVMAVRGRDGTVMVTGLPMAEVDSVVLRMGFIVGGVALAGLVAVSLAGALIIRKTLRPLERVAATAGRVAELPLHQGEVALAERVPEGDANPDTEVGQVGLALNSMLDHVGEALSARHASETRVRQFVADASHELRTPLAAIRGYAELTRRTSEEVPPEIGHAMRRVESEAVRMTSLVEDLLLLARLDAGRPLGRESVDLSRVVVDSVSDARIAGPEHDWRLELPPEPVTVSGDAHKLQQVLVNLLSNARVHTPAGTTVTTSLRCEGEGEDGGGGGGGGGCVVMVVSDDGPGIPDGLQGEVFERFSRGDTSRSRAAGSTGLGLSIVAAVVAAHEGEVSVESRPGRTRFVVRLPG
ncbi:HAMP domain-containing sensor histidine kinase [Actinosynnema sp. NPDC047251]|uniref:histidine kinase n=1 Tax=Saccharothrix espanaensis (strain ATCC 51144 / DSM 44229 / JCM 9112 / NBRC 15066 / NRRL 15764) TaxID=1179773 RepID=K0JZU8_SACES|nr:HAMP domain-containing sensor histidine kinase [Saccharothrix espanaensis]CCH29828.1 putative histidine kinase [Saccharothrix espanaensis DSM 44229]